MACGVLIGCVDVGGKSQGQNGANEENDTKYSDLSCGNNDWVKKREEGDTTMTHRSREGKWAMKRFQGKDTHGLRKLAIKLGGRGSESCELDGTNCRTQGNENLTTLVERGVLEERHDDTNHRAVARGDGHDGHDCLYGRVHISLSLFSDFIALNIPEPSPSLLPWLDLLNGTSSSPRGHDFRVDEALLCNYLEPFSIIGLHPVHPFMPNTNTCLTYHLERANWCHNFRPWLATFEQTWDSLPIDIGGTLPNGTNH
ncbi:hypothetical protein BDR06DRAFT_978021 [Suillus hirtellus]|nr:hypothetical protein BDR06DRAFT_978021 [Suillus hirtellus]